MRFCWRIIKIVFIFLVYLSGPKTVGQTIYFNKAVDIGGIYGVGWSVLEKDTGYILAGVVGGGQANIGILLLDSLGELIELKSYGKTGTNHFPGRPGSLKYTEEKYILGGGIDHVDSVSSCFLKLNETGDSIFLREYLSLSSESMYFNNSYPCFSGEFIFTGECYLNNYNTDLVLLKTDSLGNETMRVLYGWNTADNGFSVIQTPDSGFVVGGYSYQPGLDDSGDPLIVKFDKDGNYEWRRKPGGPFDDKQAMVCLNNDSSITVLTSYSDSEITYDYEIGRIHILNYSISGDINWERYYGSGKPGQSIGNIKTIEGEGWVSCGYFYDTLGLKYSSWILMIDASGDSMWYREYDYFTEIHASNKLFDISRTSDNGFITCGETKSIPPNSLQKIWILKLDSIGCDSSGCDTTVGIAQLEPKTDNYDHIVIYPNPVSNRLNIRFGEEKSTNHRERNIELISVLGTKVKELKIPPVSEYSIDVQDLFSGIYLLNIKEKGRVVFSEKLMICR